MAINSLRVLWAEMAGRGLSACYALATLNVRLNRWMALSVPGARQCWKEPCGDDRHIRRLGCRCEDVHGGSFGGRCEHRSPLGDGRLPPSTAILDLGCGSGMPIARALVDEGFSVWGIDASPSLLAAYRAHFPEMPALCEPVQGSELFGRRFAGVVAIGLIFLLAEPDQDRLLEKVAKVLEPGGRFLFSAPHQRCEWRDSLTGRVPVRWGRRPMRNGCRRAGWFWPIA